MAQKCCWLLLLCLTLFITLVKPTGPAQPGDVTAPVFARERCLSILVHIKHFFWWIVKLGSVPQWDTFCQSRRIRWKGERHAIEICHNCWGLMWFLEAWCRLWFVMPFSWAWFQLYWRKVLKLLCQKYLVSSPCRSEDTVTWLPVILKKKAQTNKSFLSWTISLRCAKAKGWVAFLNRLDFVSGPVCSVHV